MLYKFFHRGKQDNWKIRAKPKGRVIINTKGVKIKSTHSIIIMIINTQKNQLNSNIMPKCRMVSEKKQLCEDYVKKR